MSYSITRKALPRVLARTGSAALFLLAFVSVNPSWSAEPNGAAATCLAQKNPAPTSGGSFASLFAAGRKAVPAWRVYTGTDGVSHVQAVEFVGALRPFFGGKDSAFDVPHVSVKKASRIYFTATPKKVMLYSAPGNLHLPAHVSPGSEMFLILRGHAQLLIKDRPVHTFGPGDLVIFEDTSGPGHGSLIGPRGFTALNFSFDPKSPIGASTRPPKL